MINNIYYSSNFNYLQPTQPGQKVGAGICLQEIFILCFVQQKEAKSCLGNIFSLINRVGETNQF